MKVALPTLVLAGVFACPSLVWGQTQGQTAPTFNKDVMPILQSPVHIPRGTRIEVTAHYDNSANNRANPNAEVRWGDPTYYEMMIGAINFIPSESGKNAPD